LWQLLSLMKVWKIQRDGKCHCLFLFGETAHSYFLISMWVLSLGDYWPLMIQ
jgi:hypothetical protein